MEHVSDVSAEQLQRIMDRAQWLEQLATKEGWQHHEEGSLEVFSVAPLIGHIATWAGEAMGKLAHVETYLYPEDNEELEQLIQDKEGWSLNK